MPKKTNPPSILYFVQLPPPLHGVSYINQVVTTSPIVNRGLRVRVLPIRFSSDVGQLNRLTTKKVFILWGLFLRLWYCLLFFRPDMVYFTVVPVGNTFFRDLLFLLTLRLFRAKRIFHFHLRGIGPFLERHPWLYRLYIWLFRRAWIVHLSKGLLEEEIVPLKLRNAAVCAVENGVGEVLYPLRDYRCEGQVRLLFLSHLQESKGVFILLESFSILARERADVELHICGNPVPESVGTQIVEKIEAYGLRQRVFLHGMVSGEMKHSMFSQADIFVHPTLYDAFPLVVLEAMQAGLPIVASSEGAIPEMITHGETGVLVEKGNVDKLAQAIGSLLDNAEERQRLGQNARSVYVATYTLTAFEQRMRAVFEQVMNSK